MTMYCQWAVDVLIGGLNLGILWSLCRSNGEEEEGDSPS